METNSRVQDEFDLRKSDDEGSDPPIFLISHIVLIVSLYMAWFDNLVHHIWEDGCTFAKFGDFLNHS